MLFIFNKNVFMTKDMDFKKFLFAVLAIICLCDAVKVNMRGSLTLGKEVLDTFSHYMRRNYNSGGSMRRSVVPNQERDVTFLIVQSAYLCRGLRFCNDQLEKILNEYLVVHTKAVENLLMELTTSKINNEVTQTRLKFALEEQLKDSLHEIRLMLTDYSSKMKENNYASLWIEIMKKVSIMFQTKAFNFVIERVEGTPTDLDEVKKKLTQKLVIGSVIIERRYESKLCSEYNICTNNYKCSKALHKLLESFKDMSDDNVKIFLRLVSEKILGTKFYDHLSEVTTNEFQILLNDMAYSDSVPSREVLLSIHRTVEDRLTSLGSKTHHIRGRDVELVHGILSDLDHAYSKRNDVDPFHAFLSHFFKWLRTGSSLGPSMRTLLEDLTDQLNELSDDLMLKLTREVRLFLELTVDPEN